MRSVIFDTGPIISLATNNLLWILEPLKKKFNGSFLITDSVKRELIDRPLDTKKFKFEAIQVEKLIEDGILQIIDNRQISEQAFKFLDVANNIYSAFNNPMRIVHYAEMSVLALALELKADAVAIDEKTTRHLIENPDNLKRILEKTLRASISVNESNLKEFRKRTSELRTIRSVELVSVAFEQGILDKFITRLPNARQNLLESVLWGVKLNGCSVSEDEINQIIKMEK
jgi:predicted nucleic acid-binding protein